MLSPLSINTPEDKRNLPLESRIEDALKRDRSEVTPAEEIVPGNYKYGTTREVLMYSSG